MRAIHLLLKRHVESRHKSRLPACNFLVWKNDLGPSGWAISYFLTSLCTRNKWWQFWSTPPFRGPPEAAESISLKCFIQITAILNRGSPPLTWFTAYQLHHHVDGKEIWREQVTMQINEMIPWVGIDSMGWIVSSTQLSNPILHVAKCGFFCRYSWEVLLW